jgi:hypothetical protein
MKNWRKVPISWIAGAGRRLAAIAEERRAAAERQEDAEERDHWEKVREHANLAYRFGCLRDQNKSLAAYHISEAFRRAGVDSDDGRVE